MRFAGKTVLITGAAGGFGAGMAKAFAAKGARLVLGDLAAGPLDNLLAELAGDHVSMIGDVSDPAYCDALVALAVGRFDGLDIAINNAGILHTPAYFPDIPVDEARRVIEVNLLGVMFGMQAQLRHMAKTGGAIINVSSAAGMRGAPRMAAYAAAKHGVVGLTRTAALEYARRGVRVNAVCPSFARTAMAGDANDNQNIETEMTAYVPMRRLATVDEVVQATLYLADPASTFITGQMLGVDGGMSAM